MGDKLNKRQECITALQNKMLKYTESEVVFKEVPDEITLAINISNCPCKCPGCHSKHLWEDIGYELNKESLDNLIKKNPGISCVSFMGGDNDPNEINNLLEFIKSEHMELKTSWYSGRTKLSDYINPMNLDYLKLGPYIENLGGLDNPNTNQRFFKNFEGKLVDITEKFRK